MKTLSDTVGFDDDKVDDDEADDDADDRCNVSLGEVMVDADAAFMGDAPANADAVCVGENFSAFVSDDDADFSFLNDEC